MPQQRPVYSVQGIGRVPSVTTITSRFKDGGPLQWWANSIGLGEHDACSHQQPCVTCGRRPGLRLREAMQAAGDVGSFAHALIDQKVKGTTVDEDLFAHLTTEQLSQAEDCMDAFASWWNSNHVDVIETELSLVSEEYRFGGTFDCLARVGDDKTLTLIDWKTSRGIYGDYLAQLGGYVILVEEHGFGEVEQVDILRVAKETAAFHHHRFPRRTFKPAIDYFLHARTLYDVAKDVEKLLR